MKKALATIVAAQIVALLIAVTVLIIASPALGDDSMYIIVEDDYWNSYRIVYDIDTGVMYHQSNGYYNGGTMTLLVNPDGTPKVYKGFTD